MLVIFDCDGVLVDSEQLSAQVFAAQLQLEGIKLTPAQCFQKFKGFTLEDCVTVLEQEFDCVLGHTFVQRLRRATQQRFAQDLQAVHGVESVLSWLRQCEIAMCVASNGDAAKVQHSLTSVGLISYFPQRFSADLVKRGKPEPDLFLLAASTMGFSPSQCVVIEDSFSGVKAAQAAGIDVLFYNAIAGAVPDGVESFSSMEQLPAILGRYWQSSDCELP